MPLSVRWISSVSVAHLDLVKLEDGGIVLRIVGREQYSHYATYLVLQQTARLPDYQPCDDDCALQDPQAIICIGPIYKSAYEEHKTLHKYPYRNLPTGEVSPSGWATGTPIPFI